MAEEPNKSLKLTFSNDIAFILDQEAQMASITVTELLRRGAQLAILAGTAKREVDVHFPENATLNYSLTISVTADDGIVKEFALDPDLQNPVGSHITYIGEYREDGI